MENVRKKTMVVILSLLVIGVACVAINRWSKGTGQKKVATAQGVMGAPKEGEVAPDFTLSDLDGNEVRLLDFRGKVIFLNFWATWCPPCRNEMSLMEALYQKLKGEGFELLAVSLDRQGASVVGPFARDYKLTFPILLDSTGEVGNIYRVRGIPATFIIDKEGLIVEKVVGSRDWSGPDSIEKFQNLIDRD